MSIPTQIAETVQTAHIQRSPSPNHDLAPSTTASAKEPVDLDEKDLHNKKLPKRPSSIDDISLDSEDDEDNSSEIPLSVLRPHPRSPKAHFPPMPDMRFEQSYLHSLKEADTWWKVALITVRDQMVMPLAQGVLYNLALAGWQYWNKSAQLSGSSAGARVRRWWYGVNNWKIPGEKKRL
ncbi:hypothetical protein PG996_000311 [Apiospora saccharicola]|uniref:DUF1770-domain-containing protein n=1 Tax=Apiospora saccharicola TaxID=335842 RepID=A0ABR1WGD0_9PEZI